MNLVSQLTSGNWLIKIAKFAKSDKSGMNLADLAGDQHINYLSEFYHLYEELSKLMDWDDLDFKAWEVDLKSYPKTVIACFRAIKKSSVEGRQGIINEKDWIEL